MASTIRTLHASARQAVRSLSTTHAGPSVPLRCVTCSSSRAKTSLVLPATTSSTTLKVQVQVRHASKKSKGGSKKDKSSSKRAEEEIEVEDHPVPVVAKGKKARAAQMTAEDAAAEAFDLSKLEANMDNAVERLQREMRNVLQRIERITPGACSSPFGVYGKRR